MGVISEINEFTNTLTVEFDEHRFVEYEMNDLDQLELAYAVTIHKAQGSEYPAVVIPLLRGPRMLMNRNLLYTAVTRARSCVLRRSDRGSVGYEGDDRQYERGEALYHAGSEAERMQGRRGGRRVLPEISRRRAAAEIGSAACGWGMFP